MLLPYHNEEIAKGVSQISRTCSAFIWGKTPDSIKGVLNNAAHAVTSYANQYKTAKDAAIEEVRAERGYREIVQVETPTGKESRVVLVPPKTPKYMGECVGLGRDDYAVGRPASSNDSLDLGI